MSLTHASNEEIIGRDDINNIEAILSISNTDVDEVFHVVKNSADAIFTWDYSLARPQLRKLYGYLVDRGCIEQLNNFDEQYLPIFSGDVLKRIEGGDPSWEEMVPPGVAEVIKRHGYFGYRQTPPPDPHG